MDPSTVVKGSLPPPHQTRGSHVREWHFPCSVGCGEDDTRIHPPHPSPSTTEEVAIRTQQEKERENNLTAFCTLNHFLQALALTPAQLSWCNPPRRHFMGWVLGPAGDKPWLYGSTVKAEKTKIQHGDVYFVLHYSHTCTNDFCLHLRGHIRSLDWFSRHIKWFRSISI